MDICHKIFSLRQQHFCVASLFFPIGSSHLPFGNGTYFISDVAGLDFLAQPKLLLGLCHSCFKLQAVYYCLLLGPKNSYFPTLNCLKFEMSI